MKSINCQINCFLTHLPFEGLDFQVVSLVGPFDKPDTGETMEGLQTTLDDGHLPRGWKKKQVSMQTRSQLHFHVEPLDGAVCQSNQRGRIRVSSVGF